jgi:hypothetical protein
MYVNVNFFSDDLQEMSAQLELMRAQWGLAPFALWSCTGTMLLLDFASGPEAKGLVHVTIEMLPKSFVERLSEAEWSWDQEWRQRNQARFAEAHFGIGRVERTVGSKKDMAAILSALKAPKETASALKSLTVSRTREWIDDLDPKDTETTFSVKMVEKERHAITTWSFDEDGVTFTAVLDVGPPNKRSRFYDADGTGPVYSFTVSFDVTRRRNLLLEHFKALGITTMNGSYNPSK